MAVAGSTRKVSHGFDPTMAGRRAECDGGGLLAGTRLAVRHEFTGTLTGDYVEEGEPPWRWYLLEHLIRKPEGYEANAVWCEAESIFLVEEKDL